MTAARPLASVRQSVPTIEFDEEDEATIQGIHPALDVANGTLYVTVRASVGKKMLHLILTSDGQGNIAIIPVNDWQEVVRERSVPLRATADISDLPPRWNNKALRDFQNGKLEAPTWREAYDAIYQALDDHLVVINKEYLVVLTLHAMMTYFHPLFDVLPILHLYGPSESGKSRAAVALGEVAFNGKVTGSATPATVFRKADSGRYTQIITEADELSTQKSSDSFVKQLQGATTKGEAVVEVAEKSTGGAFKPRTFYAFNPRVLVSTKDFSKALTLRNRCIRLDMVKSPDANQDKLRRSITDSLAWMQGRDMLYRLQLLCWRDVVTARDTLRQEWVGEDAPTGRTFEKWLPLATVAILAGEDVLAVVKELASESMQEQQEDTAGSQMGILCHFMEYVVRGRDENLQRHEFWKKLLLCGGLQEGVDSQIPDWAQQCGDAITCGELRQMFGSEVKLVRELKRKKLIPQQPKRTSKYDAYEVKRADVLAITQLYIGRKPDAMIDAAVEPRSRWDIADVELPF